MAATPGHLVWLMPWLPSVEIVLEHFGEKKHEDVEVANILGISGQGGASHLAFPLYRRTFRV